MALVSEKQSASVFDGLVFALCTTEPAAVAVSDSSSYIEELRKSRPYKRCDETSVPRCSVDLYRPCPFCLYRYLRIRLRLWVQKQRKPYSAITVQIDRLTSEQYDENDLGGIVDLIEVIRIQDSGPSEAARAIRKKLYGCTFAFTEKKNC